MTFVRRRVLGVLIAAICVLAISVTAAIAATVVTYSDGTARGPYGYFSSSGYAARQYNRACENDINGTYPANGYIRAYYLNTAGQVIGDTGSILTHCPSPQAAINTASSYALTRCTNTDSATLRMACQTTKP